MLIYTSYFTKWLVFSGLAIPLYFATPLSGQSTVPRSTHHLQETTIHPPNNSSISEAHPHFVFPQNSSNPNLNSDAEVTVTRDDNNITINVVVKKDGEGFCWKCYKIPILVAAGVVGVIALCCCCSCIASCCTRPTRTSSPPKVPPAEAKKTNKPLVKTPKFGSEGQIYKVRTADITEREPSRVEGSSQRSQRSSKLLSKESGKSVKSRKSVTNSKSKSTSAKSKKSTKNTSSKTSKK
ncbi:unnamed protein product [Bursaphelenchus xylophilus]|nr:unnamed protein product [Bursaphelenchus xylophilus]CAG9086819.1 unnamed protein product [Bursaphelenchus xylophilus]